MGVYESLYYLGKIITSRWCPEEIEIGMLELGKGIEFEDSQVDPDILYDLLAYVSLDCDMDVGNN